MNPKCDVAVVGAGPAGMMAAIAAAGRGLHVAIVEHLPRPGAKLLVTGGRRCNLTNTLDPAAFMARLGPQGRFIADALDAFGRDHLLGLLSELGVATHCEDGMHVYPVSNAAADVQATLWRRCQTLNVQTMLGVEATALKPGPSGRSLEGLQTSAGALMTNQVVLATGGVSYPSLGATGTGYELARQAGHTVTPLTPALVGLVAKESWPRHCAGVSLHNARVWIDRRGQSKEGAVGDVLMTHSGLSGPAVLDLSGAVAEILQGPPGAQLPPGATVTLRLAVASDMKPQQWLAQLDEAAHTTGTMQVATLLGRRMPGAVAQALCQQAQLPPDQLCAHLRREHRQALANLLGGAPLTVKATEGFDKAMITRGGVKLQEIDPRTMQSRRMQGLYFAGEIIDLDGPCGGFNLQIAFSTGHLAGSCGGKGPGK